MLDYMVYQKNVGVDLGATLKMFGLAYAAKPNINPELWRLALPKIARVWELGGVHEDATPEDLINAGLRHRTREEWEEVLDDSERRQVWIDIMVCVNAIKAVMALMGD